MQEHKDTATQKRLLRKLDDLAIKMEQMKLAEYLELFSNPRRLFFMNLMAGLARGLGIAIGFTILGALVIYMLQQSFVRNLPVIGDFIAEIVRIVQIQLEMKP